MREAIEGSLAGLLPITHNPLESFTVQKIGLNGANGQ